MAKVEKIPIEIDLRTAKALREALALQNAVGDVGDEAEDAGKQSASGFDAFGKSALGVAAQITGISAGLAGVVQVMKLVHENQLAINTATAEAIRQQQQRLAESASQLGTPLNRNLAQQLGVSEVEAFRRAGTLSAQFDLPQTQVEQAVLDLIPRFPRGQAPIGDVLTFARGTGAAPQAATQLFSVLRERFGQTGAAARKSAAGIGGVAQESALTPENLLRILTPISSALKRQGIEDPVEQASVAAAFAQFEDPGAPELTKTALRQLVRLSNQPADGFTANLLRKVGADPETFGVTDLIEAYQVFLLEATDADDSRRKVRELAARTGIPPRVLGQVARTADASFEEVRQRTLRVGRGATFGQVRERAAARIAAPEAQTRSAETLRRVRGVVTGAVPGTGIEAAAILGRLTAGIGIDDPEETENKARAFRIRMIEAGFGDERLSEEVTRNLFFLLQVWRRRVSPPLETLAVDDTTFVGGEARSLLAEGNALAKSSQEHQFFGNQENEVNKFEAHIEKAIQFLRTVQTGGEISGTRTERTEGGVVTDFVIGRGTATEAQRGVVAGSAVSPLTAGGVIQNISSQTVIINGADPATTTMPNRGTGPAPGEGP